MLFNERLAELRNKYGLSKKDVAQGLSVEQSTYGKYELGKRQPSLEMLEKISNYFNVSTDYLLGKTDEPVPMNEKKPPANEQAGKAIYDKLVEIGFIKNGEDITGEHLRVLVDVLAPQLDFALFKLNQRE